MKNYTKIPLIQITNAKLKTVVLIGLIAFISCKKEVSHTIYEEDIEMNVQPEMEYSTFKKNITSQKALLKKEYKIMYSFFYYYLTSTNSTSKIKVAFGGITPPAPREPYPN